MFNMLMVAQIIMLLAKAFGYITVGWSIVFIPLYIMIGLVVIGMLAFGAITTFMKFKE